MGVADVQALRVAAYTVLRSDPDHRDAHLRLYELEQMLGSPVAALAHLRAALRSSPIVVSQAAPQPAHATRVLAITRIAPWEANVPLELIVDETQIALTRIYIDGSETLEALLALMPSHDVLFNTIAESDDARPALALAARLTAARAEPCVNPPDDVANLSRDRVAARFSRSATVVAPPVERIERALLATRSINAPSVVRPVGSQAGIGLERIASTDELRTYLERHVAPAYYVMPFVDYRRADGLFRKYRIMFVDGVPLACHLAISPRWMIHYYNAPMSEHAWMRDEEAAFLADLETVFDGPRADALREIASAVPLAYFGIDCAICADGRVLLFEADAAMLVHGTDAADVYPYKAAAYERIKTALTALMQRRYGSVNGR